MGNSRARAIVHFAVETQDEIYGTLGPSDPAFSEEIRAHTKSDLKVHLMWMPKYHKSVLVDEVAVRVRDLLQQIAAEHELEIVPGKVARDLIHMFISYRPNQSVSQIMQWLKGISSRVLLQEFAHLRKRTSRLQVEGRSVQ